MNTILLVIIVHFISAPFSPCLSYYSQEICTVRFKNLNTVLQWRIEEGTKYFLSKFYSLLQNQEMEGRGGVEGRGIGGGELVSVK